MTDEHIKQVLGVCARMRRDSVRIPGGDVRVFSFNDVDMVRAAFEGLSVLVECLKEQSDSRYAAGFAAAVGRAADVATSEGKAMGYSEADGAELDAEFVANCIADAIRRLAC